MIPIKPQTDVATAWLATAIAVQEAGGHAAHVVSTLLPPVGDENHGIREVMDEYLRDSRRGEQHIQTIETVAGTIFPKAFYRSPGISWSATDPDGAALLDKSRLTLFERYGRNIPNLRRFPGNTRGTYFERMMRWPTKGEPVNQIEERVQALRRARGKNHKSTNINDIALTSPALDVVPLSIHSATDRRLRGFPCLVHLDLSVIDGRIHLLAVYRHQYLITKAYGNMLGLHRLHRFLSEQTGYPLGELCVQATYADLEAAGGAWGLRTTREILGRASQASARLAESA